MAITCEDVKEKGSGSVFSVEQLKSLSLLDEDGIKECIIILGKEPLTKEQSSTVWSALIDVNNTMLVFNYKIENKDVSFNSIFRSSNLWMIFPKRPYNIWAGSLMGYL